MVTCLSNARLDDRSLVAQTLFGAAHRQGERGLVGAADIAQANPRSTTQPYYLLDDLCWSRCRSFRAVGSRRRSRPATALVGSDVAVSICPQALQFSGIGPHDPALPPTVLLVC